MGPQGNEDLSEEDVQICIGGGMMGVLRKLVCLFRGHIWEAKWWEEWDPRPKHYFELSCRRCPEGVRLEMIPSLHLKEAVKWKVMR